MESKIGGSLVELCRAESVPPPPARAGSSSPSLSPTAAASPGKNTVTAASSPSSKAAAAAAASSTSPVISPAQRSGAGGTTGLLGSLFPPPNCKCVLAHKVIPYLDESSLVALMRSCKRMKEITTSDDVWEGRLKDMRVNVILVNRVSNFFRAFRSDIVTLRGLEGTYDFESDENPEASLGNGNGGGGGNAPVTAVKKVVLTIAPAFLGFVTPVARVALIVSYFGLAQQDVFEGTMRYSFPKRLFVMSTYLTRAPRQEGPRFDVVVARSMRKWGTQKPAHFDAVRGGTRLIISIAQSAQAPANGYLPSNELLTVSRAPRPGELAAVMQQQQQQQQQQLAAPALPTDGPVTPEGKPSSERKFSLRSFLGGAK